MQTAPQSREVIRFGVFEADLGAGELRKNGVKIKLQDLPFRALKLLLSHPNEVVTREQFRRALWPEGVFVDFDHGISSAINRLRDALGDAADNPIFLQTVERRGYRWIAPTQGTAPVPTPPAQLVVVRQEASARPASPRRTSWQWAIVFPVAAAIVAVWGFRPAYRAAKAGTRKPSAVAPVSPNPVPHVVNPEAAQFYLKGRFYWEKRNPDGLNHALDYFTQAIVRDPNYSPAYVGLADCYNLMREYTLMPAGEAYPRALAAAQKAVELDDQSSDAHASLAFALFYGTWDAPGADREFRRAIALNPKNAEAHHWYATYLSAVGRTSESLTEIESAQALDPASKSVLADKGALLFIAGKRPESIALLRQMEAAEPDFVSPHRYLKISYFVDGDYPAYIAESRKEATLLHDRAGLEIAEAAEKGLSAGGASSMLQNMLVPQKKFYERGSVFPYVLAQTYSLLGNKQEGIHYLKLAYDRHDERVTALQQDPLLRALHDDPAFKDLVTRLGFSSQK